MKKKGFTLIELLVAIVIIALLSGLGIISYRTVFSTAEEKYYNAIESNILLAGSDYFEDHREALPTGIEYSTVSLIDLVTNKYIEEVVDTEGNLCSNGTVYAYRENNKFKYEVCLECGNYQSEGRYCSGPSQRKIVVTAKKAISNEDYPDIEKSYNKAGYSNGENIIATFSMNFEYNVKQYKVYNTRTSDEPLVCNVTNDISCSVELDRSGTYRVVAYDEDNVELSSKYINAKIAKGQANFTLDGENKYLIDKTDCSKNKTTKKIAINIVKQTNEEYESVKYQIYTDPNNKGEYKEPRGLKIEEELESGHYTLDVIVKNYSDANEKIVTKTFDVSYLIDVTYEDGSTPSTHEVVKGQVYNYLSNIPTMKGEKYIRWYKGSTEINPSEDLVTENCTFTIVGQTYSKYTITYNLNGGTNSSNNPSIYTDRTETFNIANPTKSGSTFLGWTGSNDINAGLTSYTMNNPYVASARDNIAGNDISVVSGNTYRIFVIAKRTAGTINLQGGFWYTEKTSGNAWDGYGTYFIELESLGNGWSRYYKDVTIPAGKTKGKIYFQLEQYQEAYTTSWQVADMHIISPSATISIPKGSNGNKTYNAYWKTNQTLTINPNGGTYDGTTSVTKVSGETLQIGVPTRAGYTFNGWTITGSGIYQPRDTSSTVTTTTTLNFNSSSSTVPTVYNNSGGGTVTASMVADSTATGGYSLKIVTNGTASPGAGGIVFSIFPTNPGRINVLEIKAKVPTGYKILDGGNGSYYRGMGGGIDTSYNIETSDRWRTYYLYYYTGDTGVISSNCYLHVSGSNNKSVTWYINSITMKSYTREQFKSLYTFGGSGGTLTAKWDNSGSSIVFNTNGGTFNNTYVKSWTNNFFDTSSTSARRFYFYNVAYNTHPGSTNYNWTPDSRVTTRSGYTFDGWYTAASGGTKIFDSDGTLVPSISGYSNSDGKWIKSDANITLYAHWSSQNYTVTYNNNLGQMDVWGTSYKDRWTRTYDSGTGLYNISCAGASGWELLYLPISTTSGHQYKVTFDYQIPTAYSPLSGYSGIGYQAVNSLTNNNLPSALATAYLPTAVTAKTTQTLTFTASSTVTYFALNFGMAADGVTTTIKFGNVKVYDVTSSTYVFAPSPATQSKASGGQYGTMASVSRSGYTFNGWYTAPSGGTKIESTTTYTAGANQTLYAHWTMGTYTQIYRPNGGGGSNSASETIGYWEVWISKPTSTYTKAGYTFNCWQSSTSTSCYGGNGWYYASAGVGSSRYLDATWTANNYTITFNYNGGNVGALTKTVTYGNTYTDLPVPTRTGYIFKGWYGSYDGTAATAVNYGRAYMFTNKLSVHFSAYMSNWANYGRAISCTETGGWNLETSSGNAIAACYDSGTGYKNAISSTAYSSLSAGWHDFDIIFNGTNVKLYIDGSLKATSSNYSTGKIGYNAINSLFLGGEATSSNSTASSPFFNGYIGNVVIKNTDAITSSSTYNTLTAPAQNQTLYAKWVAKTTPTITMSATSGTVVKGKTLTYKIKSNVAGKFTVSSGSTGVATVSPATITAAANTEYTVTITGVSDGTATITNSFVPTDTTNYNNASGTYTATITKSATAPTTSYCKSLTYNGSSQTLVNTAGTGYTWTAGTTRTDAGSQNVTATLSSGYRWSDNGTGTKTISCSIAQATPTLFKTETSKNIYNGRTDTYGLIPSVAGKITSSSSSTGVATVSQASNCSSIGASAQCVISVTGKSVGSATMTHTFTPNSSNYKTVTTTMPVNILNSTFTVTFAGVNPISTSFDGKTVTLAGNVAVPSFASSTLSLAANTTYVVSFDYKAVSGSNQFDVDFYPDGLPQTNPTATSTLQHMEWITSSADSRMTSCQLRFFDDFQGSGETDITITNIMLSKTSTKSVTYGNAYGDLPTPTRGGYTFDGWYTAASGGTKITSSSIVSTTSNHTLYARWTKDASSSCFRWVRKITCGGPYSDLGGYTYYETKAMCTTYCGSSYLPGGTAFCSCSCSERNC